MVYEIWCRKLQIEDDYFVVEVKADSHEEALNKCGFKADFPGGYTCMAEPRNEYGNPSYPYFEAIPKL